MKTLLGLCLCAFISLGVTGCGGSEAYIAPDDYAPPENYVPSLRSFRIVDSFFVDSSQSNHPSLVLDPYVDEGIFEVFWRANSLEDYEVRLSINDSPNFNGSILVHSEICGLGRSCDQGGNLVCEYTTDFYMSCGFGPREYDIAALFSGRFPQPLYLLLEVCDINSKYCEFDYHPVLME
jgi:hypothetical protein